MTDWGMHCPNTERVMQFLHEIGIAVCTLPGASGFIEGVEVVNGGLHVDPRARASSLLHEAGHLAIVPARFRHHLNGDLGVGMNTIMDEAMSLDLEPDSQLQRALFQMGDPEATAWAWAAGKHLDVPEDEIIRTDEYGGDGDEIRFSLALRAYVGIHGIAHAGFCVTKHNPYRLLPVYPELAFWLQP